MNFRLRDKVYISFASRFYEPAAVNAFVAEVFGDCVRAYVGNADFRYSGSAAFLQDFVFIKVQGFTVRRKIQFTASFQTVQAPAA